MSSRKSKYKDIPFDDFKKEGILIIENQEIIDIILDFYYSKIISVMREGPMTIKEITEKLNLLLRTEGKEKRLSEKEIMDSLRSEKSMYRYMKTLEKAKIVKLSGQRVVIGQTAVEKLYSRTADIFYLAPRTSKWWKGEKGRRIMNLVTQSIKLFYGIDNPNSDCLTELMARIADTTHNALFKSYDEKKQQLIELIYSAKDDEMDKALDALDIFEAIMNVGEYEEELKKCLGLK